MSTINGTALRLRRGTTAQNDTYVGYMGEVTFDTEQHTIRAHDGSKAGGYEFLTEDSTQTLSNKTLDASCTVLGLDKNDVGLGNVDNTSDVNKPVSTATQTALNLKADSSSLTAHTGNTSNPHSVTASQVGLGNVDNTSDATKWAASVALSNKTIDTAAPNTIKINGNTLSATAGTATVTIPNTTDTLVNLGSIQTLTQKTLTSPTVTTPTITGGTWDGATSGAIARAIGGKAYGDILGITPPPTLELVAYDWKDNPDSSPPIISVTRASTGTYIDALGVIRTAQAGVLRHDYDSSTGGYKGWLIEEQRTNKLLNSATLTNQSITSAATAYTLSFYGTGSVALSGTYTGNLAGTGANTRVTLTFTPTAGTLTFTVTGTVTTAQCEAGSFATSWIPTTGAEATRNSDKISILTNAFNFNNSEGVFFAEADYSSSQITSATIFNVSDGTSSNQIQAQKGAAGSDAIGCYYRVSASNLMSITAGTATPGAFFKVAIAWIVNNANATFNGTLANSDTNIASTATVTTINLGSNSSGSLPINGHIKRFLYWPKRLTNAQIQLITA